jgi:hypothetical protein
MAVATGFPNTERMAKTPPTDTTQTRWTSLAEVAAKIVAGLTPRKFPMDSFCCQVSGARVFNILKRPEIALLAPDTDDRHPAVAIVALGNTFHTALAAPSNENIGLVLCASSNAEIGDSIIGPETVDVINLSGGPIPIGHQPRDPMGEKGAISEADSAIPVRGEMASGSSSPNLESGHISEHAGQWVVIEDRSKVVSSWEVGIHLILSKLRSQQQIDRAKREGDEAQESADKETGGKVHIR